MLLDPVVAATTASGRKATVTDAFVGMAVHSCPVALSMMLASLGRQISSA